ncbi:MAG TPA: hypothetical protein VN017_03175, partial [Pseudoxanthomonas sp.]|nr:hypothetical protein [Pseudoxanthomonas sp.]
MEESAASDVVGGRTGRTECNVDIVRDMAPVSLKRAKRGQSVFRGVFERPESVDEPDLHANLSNRASKRKRRGSLPA